MNQKERLDYLVEAFKEDSVQYRDLETPRDDAGKRRILRSLMNIRMPGIPEGKKPGKGNRTDPGYSHYRKPGQQPSPRGYHLPLAGRYHKTGGRSHRERRQFADAGMFRSHAYLYR